MFEFKNEVNELLAQRSEKLYELMVGSSTYCDAPVKNKPNSRDEIMEHNLASQYVKFVSEFGFEVKEARVGDHFYTAHPENFESWLLNGCLGLDVETVVAYLRENPSD